MAYGHMVMLGATWRPQHLQWHMMSSGEVNGMSKAKAPNA